MRTYWYIFGEGWKKVFAMSADNLLNDSENSMVEHQHHDLNDQLMLINKLDEDEKNALINIINSMLTKKRMKDLKDGKANSKALKKPCILARLSKLMDLHDSPASPSN